VRKSIMQDERECFVCHSKGWLERHHLFFGPALRTISERMGLVIWLCEYHHRDNKHGVHGNRKLDLELKRMAQRKYEETHSREEWMEKIGRNYL